MARVCDVSGKRVSFGNSVSSKNNKTRRKIYPSLQSRHIYLTSYASWIKLCVATSVLRTMNKNGVEEVLKAAYTRGTLAKRLRPIVASL